MSDGDSTKYDYIADIYDIDDFELWLSFKNRDAKIEKFQYDKLSNNNESGISNNNKGMVSKKLNEKEFMEFWENKKNAI